MSRSLGASLLTSLPPMRSSPSEMSSSPAIMLRVVDLPQPDGPTKMTNSPSAMSRLILSTASAPSGKRLVTWSKTMSATARSLTRRQPLTAPAFSPATILGWKNNTKMMIGMVMTTAAAAMGPVGTVNCELPLKYAIEAGAVPGGGGGGKEIGNKNSVQPNTK